MVLAEIATYLAAYSPSLGLTAGTNLLYGMMPPSPDICVALHEYSSLMPEYQLGVDNINIEYPQVQVAVRGVRDEYDAPRLLINNIISALLKIHDQSLSGVKYYAVLPKQSPFSLAPDENMRRIFICNFHVMKDWSIT